MDLALASFHKYSQRKQQQEAVEGFLVGLVLLRTLFKPGISLWVTKTEVYISVTTYSLCWNGSQVPTLHSGKYKGVGIGSIKAENHRGQTANLVSLCRVIKNMKRKDN